MMRVKQTSLLLGAALAVAPGIAQAAEPPCLTAQEFTALATYALPGMIAGVAQRCAASLPADAFLRTGGDVLVARYATAKPAAWPAAKVAFLKFSAGAQADMASMLQALPDATLQQFVDTLSTTIVSQKLPPERCGAADEVSRLLSPLPPESVAELLAVAVTRDGRSGAPQSGKFAICPAPAVTPVVAAVPIAVPAPDLTQSSAPTSSPPASGQSWSLAKVLGHAPSTPPSPSAAAQSPAPAPTPQTP